MRVEQSTNSWRKQPPVSFFQRMTSAPSLEKGKIIDSDGKSLPKNPYYEDIKKAVKAYKSFYSIPDKLPDIKLAKKEKSEHLNVEPDKLELSLNKLNKLDKQSQKLNQVENKLINLGFDIKPFATSSLFPETENKLAVGKINKYKPAKPEEKGKNVDIYL